MSGIIKPLNGNSIRGSDCIGNIHPAKAEMLVKYFKIRWNFVHL